jgi:hypothetical protein
MTAVCDATLPRLSTVRKTGVRNEITAQTPIRMSTGPSRIKVSAHRTPALLRVVSIRVVPTVGADGEAGCSATPVPSVACRSAADEVSPATNALSSYGGMSRRGLTIAQRLHSARGQRLGTRTSYV